METNKPGPDNTKTNGRWKLLLVLAVCVAPVLASYFTYYVIKPAARTNYGDLIDPRTVSMPQLGATTLDGKPASLDAFKGKWIMLQTDSGACDEACKAKLLDMRQVRLMQGKEMDRIERVWLVADDLPIEPALLSLHEGAHVLRVKREALASWLPATPGTTAIDHIYVIDPLGNLMLRFPKNPDPYKMKKDILKLLTASSIG